MNARSAQVLAAVLGFLLIVLIGAVIFVLLSRPAQGPRVSPTPTSSAFVSPSPTFSAFPTASLLPTISPTPFPTVSLVPFPTPTALVTPVVTPEITPELTPQITPEITPAPPTPTATPSPTVAPTPTPLPIPTSPDREVRVTDFGLDGRNPELGDLRYVLFQVDGPSLIRMTLSDSSGRARICLWQGDNVEDQECETLRNGTLERAVFDTGQTQWTVSLIGVEQAIGPVVDLTLNFNANAPSVTFRNLRWQGQTAANYNGVDAAIDVAPGQVAVNGQFEFGQQHLWRVAIQAAGEGVIRDESGGPSSTFSLTQDVQANTTYIITAENPNPAAEPGTVFANVTIAWP